MTNSNPAILTHTDLVALRTLRLAANDYVEEYGFGLDVQMPLRMARIAVGLGLPSENVGALINEITDGDTQWLLQIVDAAKDTIVHEHVEQAFLDSLDEVDPSTGRQAQDLELAAQILQIADGVHRGPEADDALRRLRDLVARAGGRLHAHNAIVLASKHTTGVTRLLLARLLHRDRVVTSPPKDR